MSADRLIRVTQAANQARMLREDDDDDEPRIGLQTDVATAFGTGRQTKWFVGRIERMFNIIGRKKTEWYDSIKFSERPPTLKLKCRFYHPPANSSSREYYDLSGDDPALYDAENCLATVEMEWVHSRKRYRLNSRFVQMLDSKLASLS